MRYLLWKGGGQFAFEEFCVARLTLHEKIYLHRKVRAAEAQFISFLRELSLKVSGYHEVHRWLYLKESMLEYPEQEFPLIEGPDLFNQYKPRTPRTLGYKSLLRRDLLSRAYAFGAYNSISDPIDRHDSDRGVYRLLRMSRNTPEIIVTTIRRCLSEILATLNITQFKTSDVDIIVDAPRLSTIQQGHDTVYIEHSSKQQICWTMPVDKLEDNYQTNRSVCYIFSKKEHLPYVLLSAELTAWQLQKVICVQEDLISDFTITEAQAIKMQLDDRGFYDEFRMLKPLSEFLNTVDAQSAIIKIAESLAPFESHSKTRVSPASVVSYVSQFPAELQEVALEWLQHLQIVRPDTEFKRLLPSVFTNMLPPDCKSIGFSPLGASTDSASRISYDLRNIQDDISDDIRLSQVILPQALGMKLDAYVLYDDNSNTGRQALSIFSEWTGMPLPQGVKLDEEHVQKLRDDLIDEFKTKNVIIVFSVATEYALVNISNVLHDELGFKESKCNCIQSMTLLERNKIFSGPDSPFQHRDKTKLRDFLLKIGTELFISEGKSEEIATRRALGVSGTEAMVVFPYNVPTMTIAPLWIKGECSQGDWIPLVARRRRQDHKTGAFVDEDA